MTEHEVASPAPLPSSLQGRGKPLISEVEVYRLRLPYRKSVSFKSVRESAGQYVVLRLVAEDGTSGLAEAVCRPQQSGEDAHVLGYQLETFFSPMLIGSDPMDHLGILAALESVKFCASAKSLIDIALWDLRGKLLGQPVWRLLGAEAPEPVPLTWIAHGGAVDEVVDEARRAAQDRGYRGMKLKTWRRSPEDVELVAKVRASLGPETMIYVDGNGAYSDGEARTILAQVAQHGVSFIEEPCRFADPFRQAALSAALPVPLLGDQSCTTIAAVALLLQLRAVGAVSVKLRRTGLTNSLKIISMCEAAGIPVVVGTDSESRIGALPRVHLRAALPYLAPWPIETHFFEKLEDDAFVGEFLFRDGAITPTDTPGFGAALDQEKAEAYAL